MPQIENIKVLIVDDHFLPRQIVADVMRKHKVRNVAFASDGIEARDTIIDAYERKMPFDVVFLDWNMPGLTGIDILKHFRSHPAFARTAFIMLTAETSQADVLDAVKSGATAYIAKPVSKDTISKKFLDVVQWINRQPAAV